MAAVGRVERIADRARHGIKQLEPALTALAAATGAIVLIGIHGLISQFASPDNDP
jgi:hypothetical protein